MPDTALLALPVEILQIVSGQLDSRGLSGFSRTCKTLRAAASSSLFCKITLRFVDIEKLEKDLDRWTDILDLNSSWKAVQRLEIHDAFDKPPLLGIPDLGDDPREPWRSYATNHCPQLTRENDQDFAKLATFIDRLPALMDMVWASSDQLPPCVLSVLEQEDRAHRLRLYLRKFCIRSLSVRPGVPIEVDSYERRLATSPVLYSLASRCSAYDSEGNANFNQEAIMTMAASLAPNLKELFLCKDLPGRFPAILAASNVARQRWHGNEMGEGKQSKQKSLTTLVIAGHSHVDELRVWHRKTDFAKLRTLKLYQDVPIEDLCWLTELRPFSEALEEIGLDFSHHEILDATNELEDFIDSLPPLRALRLVCASSEPGVLEVAFRRHGDSLRTLRLGETISDINDLSNIRDSCPNLRELAVTTTRSAGNADEIGRHRTIGALQHLRCLILTLHVHYRLDTVDDASIIRAALIDSAVDKSLAASIFGAVSASSTVGHGSLETLRLSVQIDQASFDHELEITCKMLARSWQCEKNPGDDAPKHSCFVAELGAEDREDYESAFGRRLDPEIEAVMRDLWPEQATGDWRHDWHSWALQDTAPH
ncbi:hypothetical protein M409DRAFT_48991 [Zasmidium cellare ATCC 36951]|uniref:F-box domain-containing protein n=1 Tax=Zasmidium cellare ATCC 36951 TaxID=1080233 RepID=A0A6A6D401_ZASCE|nr:uncharacterized protein M409DRAFT_48991 [Zasmidium cellare ATCC 36951]KAF2174117.1 hypothetical protein M409DRAFT_48991 [Zasmidium cellare ATCC 36951]